MYYLSNTSIMTLPDLVENTINAISMTLLSFCVQGQGRFFFFFNISENITHVSKTLRPLGSIGCDVRLHVCLCHPSDHRET